MSNEAAEAPPEILPEPPTVEVIAPAPAPEVAVPETLPENVSPIEPVVESPSTPAEVSQQSLAESVVEPVPEPESAPSFSSPPPLPQNSLQPAQETSIRSRREAALEKRRANKQERLEEIVVTARKKRKITNNDVQLLLGVSDATATNYLNQLVLAARLKRVGVAGHAYYEPI